MLDWMPVIYHTCKIFVYVQELPKKREPRDMSGTTNARDVEMGPIWNHADAKTKAKEYIDNRPWLKWTGHWSTTVPGVMSTINVRNLTSLEGFARGEHRNVHMGPIWNQQDAVEKARAFIEEHPFLEWTGHWNTTEIGKMSHIVVRLKERSQVCEASRVAFKYRTHLLYILRSICQALV